MTLTRRLMWTVAIILSKLAMCSCGGAPPGASAAPVQRQNTVKDGRPQVPHPNTTVPAEIIANIAAVARQTSLGQPFQMDALKEADVKLRARRILDVKSLDPLFGPDYYLVELDDLRSASSTGGNELTRGTLADRLCRASEAGTMGGWATPIHTSLLPTATRTSPSNMDRSSLST